MKQKSEELNKLSIVIPTFDRQKYALRSMKYWSDNGIPKVHVLDGSKEPIEQKYLEDLGENLFYYHWPMSMSQRLINIGEYLTTPFTTLMADDEFLLPSGLEMAIKI